jgi:transposase-like protein
LFAGDPEVRILGYGITTAERGRIKALERENGQLRQTNKVLKKALAYFALLSYMND